MVERLLNWFFRKLRGKWITALLLGILMSVLIYGFQEANWVRDEAVLSSAFGIGILFGWLLSRSRFHGAFAALYVLIIAVMVAVEGIGGVLPSPLEFFGNTPREVIEQMNLRIVSVSLRIQGWIETLQLGDNVEDPALFVGLFGAVLTICGAWLIWNIQRKRNVLLGLLPVGILFAINIHLSRQPLINYMFFLFITLLLIARTEYNRQHEEWEHRRVDYPEQLGLEWGGVALTLALVIALIARGAPLLGTPEGWQAIANWVNQANEQTTETATRLFSGVNPPPPVQGVEPEVSVNTPDLGEIGAPLPQGTSTIMWVSTSDPPPPPPEAGIYASQGPRRVHYWRNSIFQEYSGRGWQPAPLGETEMRPIEENPPGPPEGRYILRQAFEIVARHNGSLFAVNDPKQSGSGVTTGEVIPDGSNLLQGSVVTYEVVSHATRVTANQLAAASTDYSAEISAAYLQLPDTLPDRVRSLTNRIVVGTDNSYDKAIRIQSYLRENFTYDLSIREAPPRRDVVDYFLFDVQAGFCSHYATAMSVMLRSAGVPSRVVTGYATGEYQSEFQAYRVPESASHAWVEVYFPEYGWIEFEPTVARSAIEYEEELESRAEGESGQAAFQEEEPAGPVKPLFVALLLGGMLLLIGLPVLLLRMFAMTRQPSNIQIDTLYRRMRRALSWAGLAAVGSVTPDEYLALYTSRLEPYETMHKALQQTTALYRETVFSQRTPAAYRVRNANILWQRSLTEWLTLWFRVKWNKFRVRFKSNVRF